MIVIFLFIGLYLGLGLGWFAHKRTGRKSLQVLRDFVETVPLTGKTAQQQHDVLKALERLE